MRDFEDFSRALTARADALEDHPHALAEWRATTARELAACFVHVSRELDVTGLLEVGAYRAETSRRFVEDRPGSEAIAVEANPFTFAEHTLRDLPAGVTALNLAVSDSTDATTLRIPTESGDSTPSPKNASLLGRSSPPSAEVRVTVEASTVDDLVDQYLSQHRSVAIWIDAEGVAHEVIAGAARTLRSQRVAVLLVEVETRGFWLEQRLASDVLELLLRMGLRPIARDAEYRDQYNVLLASPRASDIVARAVERHFAGLLAGPALALRFGLRRHLRTSVGLLRKRARRAMSRASGVATRWPIRRPLRRTGT